MIDDKGGGCCGDVVDITVDCYSILWLVVV